MKTYWIFIWFHSTFNCYFSVHLIPCGSFYDCLSTFIALLHVYKFFHVAWWRCYSISSFFLHFFYHVFHKACLTFVTDAIVAIAAIADAVIAIGGIQRMEKNYVGCFKSSIDMKLGSLKKSSHHNIPLVTGQVTAWCNSLRIC